VNAHRQARRIISACFEAGVTLSVSAAGRLAFIGARQAVESLLPSLRAHKTEILAALRAESIRDAQDDLAEYATERAAVLEYDQGLPRAEAESAAIARTLVHFKLNEWYGQPPMQGGGTYLSDSTFPDALAALQARYGARLLTFSHREDPP
jgi:hypothetical protein